MTFRYTPAPGSLIPGGVADGLISNSQAIIDLLAL
jgi:hypothetical protein